MEAPGSTGTVRTFRDGLVLKSPWDFKSEYFISDTARSFRVERKILESLEPHPRIVRYVGIHEDGTGLLLGAATHGDLQDYIDHHHADLSPAQMKRWYRQATEAIDYIHRNGIIHCDIRLANFLVHESDPGLLDLCLCDFGGSLCQKLGLDGKGLASAPFWHPLVGIEPTPALDIFGLGTVLYLITVGRWPFRDIPGRPRETQDRERYETEVETRFGRGEFPDVSKITVGDVIMGCWTGKFATTKDVLDSLDGLDRNSG